jgi:hypothetical protein
MAEESAVVPGREASPMKHVPRLVILVFALSVAGVVAPFDLQAQQKPVPKFLPKFGKFGSGKGVAPKGTSKADPALADTATPEQIAFFEKNIRPVLVKECYSCHAATAEKIRGGLTLDTRDGIRKGGDSGPAVVPGNPKSSLLVQAIKHTNDERKMPPKAKLDDAVIADFEKWVAMGAPDPRDGATRITKNEIDIDKGRQFWAFRPVRTAAPPAVKDAAWPRGDIDRFLLAALEAQGLKPVADAEARTLIRRAYFDLIGLPPAPEEVETFVRESAMQPQAVWEAVVDRLLASPRFGERWGRHWLDVARFAESSGRANNFAYPHAWRYRDYVIAAFNADKPFDRFIREQLAGDLLTAADDAQKTELTIATGFLALGPKTHNERMPRQFLMDLVDEQIDATFQAFQGLTVACARCHDHKFDPIPQKDYYALAGIFRSTETCYGTIRIVQSNHPSPLIPLPSDGGATVALEPLTPARRTTIEQQIKNLRDQLSNLSGSNAQIQGLFLRTQIAVQESQLAQYTADGTPQLFAMGVRERPFAIDSPVFVRGELDQPSDVVRRGFPQVLTPRQPFLGPRRSGRRELADWIVSRDNPLTARVMANRVWLHLIGRGLVTTPDNFGASGQTPSHPELLDHLAASFVENGWSVKKLIRTIVLSRAYRLSSQFDQTNYEADPDNVLVWRMPKRRLEAEALRDAILAASGRLDLSPPKGSLVARIGEGNAQRLRQGGDPAMFDTHRTVYLPIVRDQVPEALTLFDFPDPSLIIGERATTTIPAQSLYLMNNPFVIRQADALAVRLMAVGGNDVAKVTQAYQLCYARTPSPTELSNARQFLLDYSWTRPPRATWAALCQALFASAEFSHR